MKVIGNPFGEFRGRLGGTVFTRNRAGATARIYVKPVNTNTVAQQVSRANFRLSAQAWKTLTQAQQQTWATFVSNVYNPLRAINAGQFTGNQGYVAIRTSINNALQRTFVTTWIEDGPLLPVSGVVQPFTVPQNAPLASVLADVAQPADPPAGVVLNLVDLTAAGVVQVKVDFTGTPAGGLDAANLTDSNGNLYTLSCYISDVVNQAGNRPKNPFNIRLGNAELNDFSVAGLDASIALTAQWDMSSLIGSYKQWVQTGQIVQATAVLVAQNGTQVRIGDQYIAVT